MITTLVILTIIIAVIAVHKGLMKAVESYEYEHNYKEYNNISRMLYWDNIKLK